MPELVFLLLNQLASLTAEQVEASRLALLIAGLGVDRMQQVCVSRTLFALVEVRLISCITCIDDIDCFLLAHVIVFTEQVLLVILCDFRLLVFILHDVSSVLESRRTGQNFFVFGRLHRCERLSIEFI